MPSWFRYHSSNLSSGLKTLTKIMAKHFALRYNIGHQFGNSWNWICLDLKSLQWMYSYHVFQEVVAQGQFRLKVCCYFNKSLLHLLLILLLRFPAALLQQCFNINYNIQGFKGQWLAFIPYIKIVGKVVRGVIPPFPRSTPPPLHHIFLRFPPFIGLSGKRKYWMTPLIDLYITFPHKVP